MKIVEILCHPRPGSYNLALAATRKETLQSTRPRGDAPRSLQGRFRPCACAPELARSYSLDGLVQIHCQELAARRRPSHFPSRLVGPAARGAEGMDRQGVPPGRCLRPRRRGFRSAKGWTPLLDRERKASCSAPPTSRTARDPGASLDRRDPGQVRHEARCHVLRDLRRTDPGQRRAWMDFMNSTIEQCFPAVMDRQGAR